MTVKSISYLNKISNYLKIQPKKINLDNDSLPFYINNNEKVKGFLNIIQSFLKESTNHSDLQGKDDFEVAEIRQWIEYGICYTMHHETSTNLSQILAEFNDILLTRSYLVSHRVTIADVFFYYIFYNIIENLPYLDKEKYINISRWFNNIQQDPAIRQSNKIINFITIYLKYRAPVKY